MQIIPVDSNMVQYLTISEISIIIKRKNEKTNVYCFSPVTNRL